MADELSLNDTPEADSNDLVLMAVSANVCPDLSVQMFAPTFRLQTVQD